MSESSGDQRTGQKRIHVKPTPKLVTRKKAGAKNAAVAKAVAKKAAPAKGVSKKAAPAKAVSKKAAPAKAVSKRATPAKGVSKKAAVAKKQPLPNPAKRSKQPPIKVKPTPRIKAAKKSR